MRAAKEIFREFLSDNKGLRDSNSIEFPILWFGDKTTSKPQILTIGIRPDVHEYGYDRFPDAPLWLANAYNEYFKNKPNIRYFGMKSGNTQWEGLLHQLDASYYDSSDYTFQGIHMMIQPMSSDVSDKMSKKMAEIIYDFARDAQFVIAENSAYDYLVSCGKIRDSHVFEAIQYDDYFIRELRSGIIGGARIYSLPAGIDFSSHGTSEDEILWLFKTLPLLLPTDISKLENLLKQLGLSVEMIDNAIKLSDHDVTISLEDMGVSKKMEFLIKSGRDYSNCKIGDVESLITLLSSILGEETWSVIEDEEDDPDLNFEDDEE